MELFTHVSAPRVVMVGGGSSVGKTTLARELLAEDSVRFIAVDELVAGLADERLRFPAFPQRNVDEFGAVLFDWLLVKHEVVEPPLRRLIESALDDGGTTTVIDGEGLTPRMLVDYGASGAGGAFIVERDGERLLATLRARSAGFRALDQDRQFAVADMNRRYNNWVAAEAERCGAPVVASQPWETLRQRFTATVREAAMAVPAA